jgi:hypothetical protein
MWKSVLHVLEKLSDDATNATQKKTTASGLLEKKWKALILYL